MNGLPEPDPDTGLLPPGRYAANLETLHAELVAAPHFTESTTRADLWAEWEQHRALVDLWTSKIARIWLGGSFTSRKLDPSDVDVTYLIQAAAYDRLDEEAVGTIADLADRTWCLGHRMRVDAYVIRLPEDVPVWQLNPALFSEATNGSFRDIGLYDEIWQRTRSSPTGDGQARMLRRGYVEVLL